MKHNFKTGLSDEDAILQYLMQRPGQWVNTAEIGKQLNIYTRAVGMYASRHRDILERKVCSSRIGTCTAYRYTGESA